MLMKIEEGPKYSFEQNDVHIIIIKYVEAYKAKKSPNDNSFLLD